MFGGGKTTDGVAMNILGLSFGFHDASAALLRDGVVIAAGHEERFTRRKHDAGFPRRTIAWCLEQGGITAGDLDAVVFYEQPLKKFDRVLWCAEQSFIRRPELFDQTLESWLRDERFDVRQVIARETGVAEDKIHFTDHHDSHMAAAFFCSDFTRATVVTLDGVGEYDTASWGLGDGSSLRRMGGTVFPDSLGLFYSAFTAYLGFEVNEGEYKVMGMAAYGQPVHADELFALFDFPGDGTFRLRQDWFEFVAPVDVPFTAALTDRFGPARAPESPFAVREQDLPAGMTVDGVTADEAAAIIRTSRHYADIAASVQAAAERVVLRLVDEAVAATGVRDVCLAGGVALNSLANGRLIRERGYRLYVHPAAGDGGSAIGAAAFHYFATLGRDRVAPLTSAYLGRGFDDAAVAAAVRASGYDEVETFTDDAALVERVAGLIADGAVIGWFQGRAEWGPRALGHRSILADPTNPAMQRVVNEKVKFREPFRPFAPATLREQVDTFFECGAIDDPARPEYFMLAVHPVRPEKRDVIPAITHADGTARVQVVSEAGNPLFYRLLQAFERRRGVPVLINTSFNLRGEPVVDTPEDALRTFAMSGLEYLVLHRTVIGKKVAL